MDGKHGNSMTVVGWERWLRQNFVVVDKDALHYLAMNMADVAYMSARIALSEILDTLIEGVDGSTPDWALNLRHIITIA